MRSAALLAAVAIGGFVASPPNVLHVLRTSPSDGALPTAVVTVTFDRPVAGRLEGTVDPRTVFSITPAVAGRVEWRDPITLRFLANGTLAPGVTYTVTIAPTLRAMDGARLEAPFRFSFRVGGPRPLAGTPVGRYSRPQYVRPDGEYDVLFSSPVNLASLSREARIAVDAKCAGGGGSIPLTATAQRPVGPRDPGSFREYEDSDSRLSALRRVVHLVPARALPLACRATLVLPLADGGRSQSWEFTTHGTFRFAGLTCTNDPQCPAGWALVSFSTPVKGADVLRYVHLSPNTRFTVSDTGDTYADWQLQAPLRIRSSYTVRVDTALRDVFGQSLIGVTTRSFTTTGYAPSIDFPTGRMLVERESFRTLSVRHVNVDTVVATFAAVPESLEARVLAAPEWNSAAIWDLVKVNATTREIALQGAADTPLVSAVKLPVYNAARPGSPALTVVRIAAKGDTTERRYRGLAIVQVTDLGIAAKLGAEEALVWVTTVHDGAARPGASVTLFDRTGRVRARGTTDAQGIARLSGWRSDTAAADSSNDEAGGGRGYQGYASVTWNSDRAVVAFDDYSWELSPWRFNVNAADPVTRLPAAAAVFTERGIYRPGETVYAKAIARTGSLGALRVPARGDSLRWVFYDRDDENVIRDTVVALSAFGTADQALPLAPDRALGTYHVGVKLRRAGQWSELGSAWYQVAEYRPPEFLVGLSGDTAGRYAGDTVTAMVEARYLFGAAMARTPVTWTARRVPLSPWDITIPGAGEFMVGDQSWWWDDSDDRDARPRTETISSGTDTLDAAGHASIRVASGIAPRGRASRLAIEARVTDVNRQSVAATWGVTVHPAALYVGVKPSGDEYFWRAGTPVEVGVIAVRPDGRRLSDVTVHGVVVRREWHVVQRRRDGLDERVGEWVSDTAATCDVTTADAPRPCRFTPAAGGTYLLVFTARDAAGRAAETRFTRWATGRGWVPWGDENQFKMDVIPDRTEYNVGDTATVLFASPFTDAEALITVEREGIIEQRRIRLASGATTLKFPVSETWVPNAFVSIVVARGRSAAAGGIADPGRPALRVGYAELKVTPSIKRLRVDVRPLAREYRPGDTARVHVKLADSRGTGRRGEVTLWAVDEGVLSLTGYRTPDPIELLYRARGVGMRLASDLVSIAAQVSDSEGVSLKGDRAPGGGGGLEGGDILRSRFQTTAFFLGSVLTDENGDAEAAARLPDNLTTFRVMAVAVTAGDRYGSGASPMLVTRPLVARPALPRFLRRDDRFLAGVVVNQRAGGTPTVRVRANVRGAVLTEASPVKTATLAPGRGVEVRFVMRDTVADTAAFRFDVGGGGDSDAVLTRLPVRPSYAPRTYAAAGPVRLTSTTDLLLPAGIDPARSKVTIGVGTSPLPIIAAMYRNLAVYPFDCSEQVSSEMLPIAALLRADAASSRLLPRDARAQLDQGVRTLSQRIRSDGGVGLWSAGDWTSPWLSAYAGEALLAAKAAGASVPDTILGSIAGYVSRWLRGDGDIRGPIKRWMDNTPARLAEQLAAADFLSRVGRPDVPTENTLLRTAPQMAWEDRARLATMLARRGAVADARPVLAALLATVKVEGRRAVLPDSVRSDFYFWSSRRPATRLLSAVLAIDPANAIVGPLVETIVERGRGASWWNTQDYGSAVEALADFNARQRRAARRGYTLAANGQVLLRSNGDQLPEVVRPLTGLLTTAPDGNHLAVTIAAQSGDDAATLFYHVSVEEVPLARPVTPDQQGIAVERWYEDYTTGRPIVSAVEGSLVRVRLRITLPAERSFLALTDPLPAGLEAVDLSLRTAGSLPGPAATAARSNDEEEERTDSRWGWDYGSWDSGWWSPFDHREMHDDRVAWVATYLWPGTFTATYVARATTPGAFVRPPAHAEEMYNPAVQGRSDGGIFTVTRRTTR